MQNESKGQLVHLKTKTNAQIILEMQKRKKKKQRMIEY
jgi:hypothetical protein